MSRQVLKFELDAANPTTEIDVPEDRFYEPLDVGMFSDDSGWTTKPAIWMLDRPRQPYENAEISTMRIVALPSDIEVTGSLEGWVDEEKFIGTIVNGDQTYIRHVFDVTEY